MNNGLIYNVDNDDLNYSTLQEAIYIREGDQVTTLNGRSPWGGYSRTVTTCPA